MKKAYFAGGCFWCIAPVFREMEGVESVISGYCGGDEENPSYEDVKAQRTHHRETICTSTYINNLVENWKSSYEFSVDDDLLKQLKVDDLFVADKAKTSNTTNSTQGK